MGNCSVGRRYHDWTPRQWYFIVRMHCNTAPMVPVEVVVLCPCHVGIFGQCRIGTTATIASVCIGLVQYCTVALQARTDGRGITTVLTGTQTRVVTTTLKLI
jgi:hypothetical protein